MQEKRTPTEVLLIFGYMPRSGINWSQTNDLCSVGRYTVHISLNYQWETGAS